MISDSGRAFPDVEQQRQAAGWRREDALLHPEQVTLRLGDADRRGQRHGGDAECAACSQGRGPVALIPIHRAVTSSTDVPRTATAINDALDHGATSQARV